MTGLFKIVKTHTNLQGVPLTEDNKRLYLKVKLSDESSTAVMSFQEA